MQEIIHPQFSWIINLTGSICLLLWGSLSVRQAVETSFKSNLRIWVSVATNAPIKALIGGIVSAFLMQSATATTLLTTGLITAGTMPISTAIIVVLGADLGSALAARLLFLDISLLPPILLIIGMVFYRNSSTWRWKYLGQILVGLGIMLLAIIWMKQSVAPLTNSQISADWLSVLRSTIWVTFVIMVFFTWLLHSSVAAVLVIATLAHTQLVPLDLALVMLLGANVGAGLIILPMIAKDDVESRSVVLCNLLARIVFALAGLLCISWLYRMMAVVPLSDSGRVILLHILLNGLIAIGLFPFASRIVTVLYAWLLQRSQNIFFSNDREIGSGLEPEFITQPGRAIICARREAYRLGDVTEILFSKALTMFYATDRSQIEKILVIDNEIDARDKCIHRYLSEVRRNINNKEEEKRLDEILHFSSVMEGVGDFVVHNLSRLAIKRLNSGVTFPNDGLQEIIDIHNEVVKMLREYIHQFVNNELPDTKTTHKTAKKIQKLCHESILLHRKRLSEHQISSSRTSTIHLDAVRDLLQIALLIDSDIAKLQ